MPTSAGCGKPARRGSTARRSTGSKRRLNCWGLDAEQVILPHEHLLLKETGSLPAIILTNAPNGALHFVVAWRTVGPWVQVMDPQCGRRWVRARDFLESLYLHGVAVSAPIGANGPEGPPMSMHCDAGRPGSGSPATPPKNCSGRPSTIRAGARWRTLDAALRMTTKLVEDGGVAKGREALRLISSLIRRASELDGAGVIPNPFHTAQPAPGRPDILVARGR